MKTLTVNKGERFGRLVVIKEVEPRLQYKKGKVRRFLCQCDCGNMTTVDIYHLIHGRIKSCGCYKKEPSLMAAKSQKYPEHMTSSRLYTIWNGIKSRCYVKTSTPYKRYGAKGITMCDEWKNDFTSFYNWSIENGYADNLTLDRINGEGNYEPSNCRWVSYTEQANNMKSNVCLTLNGESHTYAEWGRIVGIRSATLQQRKYAGWSDERTLTTPVRRKKSRKYMEE